jgi:hypothetical protein
MAIVLVALGAVALQTARPTTAGAPEPDVATQVP